ncbi:MAG TPA: histidine phosphatase family protein [Myxococcales bacterium]|nr:histidine phosphatase family protein [Myxococcales bacterium]
MLLYLARHAQTASSAVDSFNGRGELPLTERGREQARRLGARLSAVRFAAVYRSPLGRTGETAALVAPAVRAEVLPGLSEIDYGEWEGLSPAQARARDPVRYDAWVADPAQVGPPGGETAAQVGSRALAALETIRSRHENAASPVLAVSHKATLRILGAALTGAPISKYRLRWSQDECALDLVELRAGKDPFLRLWNDTSHLGEDPATTTRGGK